MYLLFKLKLLLLLKLMVNVYDKMITVALVSNWILMLVIPSFVNCQGKFEKCNSPCKIRSGCTIISPQMREGLLHSYSCLCVCVCVCVCVWRANVCMHICLYKCVYVAVCSYVFMCVCVCVCVCVCIHVYMCVLHMC